MLFVPCKVGEALIPTTTTAADDTIALSAQCVRPGGTGSADQAQPDYRDPPPPGPRKGMSV